VGKLAQAALTPDVTRRLAGPVRYTPVTLGEAQLYRNPVIPGEPPSEVILPQNGGDARKSKFFGASRPGRHEAEEASRSRLRRGTSTSQ
jgi:hypothetical protein